ncbi:MAG: DUF2163 domain-containing protein [Alphaproteobacteria bacterium]|nr:MAG: DUF2163 domain-containing protein [Alphaproteobacteria bacterium]
MRTLPAGWEEALAGDLARLALCWRIRRADGVVVALTGHDRPLTIDGLTYYPASAPDLDRLAESGAADIGHLAVAGALSDPGIRARDIREGRYDGAVVTALLVLWDRPELGALTLKQGRIGRVSSQGSAFRAELRGLLDRLEAPVGERFTPFCRAELGDGRCKRGLRAFTRETTVAGVLGPQQLTVTALPDPDHWHDFGRLRFHTGANAGRDCEISEQIGTTITLFAPPPAPVAVGDVVEVEAGCDKRLATCRDKFDNVENFRGEPFLPGIDRLFDYRV